MLARQPSSLDIKQDLTLVVKMAEWSYHWVHIPMFDPDMTASPPCLRIQAIVLPLERKGMECSVEELCRE